MIKTNVLESISNHQVFFKGIYQFVNVIFCRSELGLVTMCLSFVLAGPTGKTNTIVCSTSAASPDHNPPWLDFLKSSL